MEPDLDDIVAYHEAGHAVVAFLHGGQIHEVTLEPPDDDGPRRMGQLAVQWPALPRRESLLAELRVSLAGPIAEMQYLGESWQLDAVAEFADDWRLARQFANQLHSSSKTSSGWLDSEQTWCHEILEQPPVWAAVAALADELVAHQTLESNQAMEVLQFWLHE